MKIETPTEKLLLDELCAAKAASAELMQRLMAAHSALHIEQVAHAETKARLHKKQETR